MVTLRYPDGGGDADTSSIAIETTFLSDLSHSYDAIADTAIIPYDRTNQESGLFEDRNCFDGIYADFSDTTGRVNIEAGLSGDVLIGGSNDDRLFGGPGNDIIEGGAGADALDGGPQFDIGGASADPFVFFAALGESGSRNTITDFLGKAGAGDRIVVLGNTTTLVDTFTGAGRTKILTFTVNANTQAVVVDSHGEADSAIKVSSTNALTADDFVLPGIARSVPGDALVSHQPFAEAWHPHDLTALVRAAGNSQELW